jgi:prepilin-type N-terminal cleavage/methylation domain-containing protein
MKSKLKARAFTLIELLVVIAIIAILAAILFPVFAQAKAAAKNAVDISNIKQLGTASALYLNDYDDTYPASHSSANNAAGAACSPIWPAAINPYVKAGGLSTTDGYAPTGVTIFHDPVDSRISNTYVGYVVNGMISGVFTEKTDGSCAYAANAGSAAQDFEPSQTSSALQSPSDVLWLADAAPVVFTWYNPIWTTVPSDLIRPHWDIPGSPDPTSAAAQNWVQTNWIPLDLTDGWSPQGNPWSCPIGSWDCKGLDYIHTRTGNKTGTANISYADTHAKGMHFGQFQLKNLFPSL